jgi:hypothetical protein
VAGSLIESSRGSPLRSYDRLTITDRGDRRDADMMMAVGWKLPHLPLVELDPPLAWDDVCSANRSWAFQLHAWHFLGPVLVEYDRCGEDQYLQFALRLMRDWITSYPSPDTPSEFAWYGMAVGLRAYRLGYLLDALVRTPNPSLDDVSLLAASVLAHARELADDSRFVSHQNQGLFQVGGQLALATRFPQLPGMREAKTQASARLRALLGRQFTDEGVHREHSPRYHHLVLRTLVRMIEAELIDDPAVLARRRRIEEALAWLILPNQTFAMFGDSVAAVEHVDELLPGAAPSLTFALTGGRAGERPAESLHAFPKGGYAVVRQDRSYLAQISGFHSRTHKHADDLSFVWYDRGEEILVDSGCYGYLGHMDPESELGRSGFWYSDPKRVYCESTRAHNTVEIDGVSYRRRGVRPYHSALTRTGERAGTFFIEAQVRHRKSILHNRLLCFRPAEWLLVLDVLNDTQDLTHDYVQRFHFAPELDVKALGSGLSVVLPSEAQPLYVVPLLATESVTLVRGQTEPTLLGWTSRELLSMSPLWTGGFRATDVSDHAFATLFAFSDGKPLAVPRLTRLNKTGRRGRLAWSIGPRLTTLELSREPDAPFALDYKVEPRL